MQVITKWTLTATHLLLSKNNGVLSINLPSPTLAGAQCHMVETHQPSTMSVALDIPEPSLEHSTNDWLFSDVTL